MSVVTTLPLSNVVDVAVLISPQAPATPTFNIGLIVGTSTVIGSVTGANPRIRQYTTLAAMATDGFSVNSPEYIAASIYFSQTPAPQYVQIGRQDLTAIAAGTIAVGGENYLVGDLVTVVQAGASLGVLQVLTIGGGGVVETLGIVQGAQGTLYSIANGLTTTGGTGTGLTVDITAIGETALQAVQACRVASPSWYPVVALAAADSDSIAIGEWAQAQTPQLVYMFTTGTAAVLNGTTGNVLSVLKAANYNRAFGIYSTIQGGLAPNNIYAACAAMGVAMGLNTGLAGSYFTMKFKALVGITAEPLSQSQINVIEGNNGNLCLSFANSYAWLEQGTVTNGQFFDQILNIDMLASDYQYSCVDLLISNPAILQSQSGQAQILNTINAANARAAARGFISAGVWTGPTISFGTTGTSLTNGQSLPNGYTALSPNYSSQTPANRALRQSMPVYSAIIQSGAVHSILIGLYVQQ